MGFITVKNHHLGRRFFWLNVSKHRTSCKSKQAIVAWLKSCAEGATGGNQTTCFPAWNFSGRKVWWCVFFSEGKVDSNSDPDSTELSIVCCSCIFCTRKKLTGAQISRWNSYEPCRVNMHLGVCPLLRSAWRSAMASLYGLSHPLGTCATCATTQQVDTAADGGPPIDMVWNLINLCLQAKTCWISLSFLRLHIPPNHWCFSWI